MGKLLEFPNTNPNVVESEPSNSRWKADIEYRDGNAGSWDEVYFEEIADLHAIIERGPDWNTMVRCTITLNRHSR